MKCMEISPSCCGQYSNMFVFDLQLFAGEKTEDPTAKRRDDARKKGQIGRSQEISAAFVLLGGFFAMKVLGASIYTEIANYTVYIFGHLNQDVDTESVMQLFLGIMVVLAKTALPIMVIIMVIGLAINLFQVGVNFTTEPLEFKFDNLNPITGFGRIFSKRSLVELIKSIIKIVIIGFFIYRYLMAEVLQMPKLIYLDLYASMQRMADIIFTLSFQICGVFLIMAVLDLLYQKWQNTQELKMSKQDVKEEMKQTEGDPQIKGKIRQKQRQMAMQRMMREVPKADVIVTNPTHFAVALQYSKGMTAPVVIAKGKDLVAQRIKEVAR